MSSILKRTLIFLGLMVAGLVFYALWFGIVADKFNETSLPYLEKTLPVLDSWDYADLKPHLSEQAQAAFDSQNGRVNYRLLAKLGRLNTIGKPQYTSSKTEFVSGLGKVGIVSYSIPVEFETGPATIKINLVEKGDSYQIHHLRINSAIYAKTEDQ